MNPFVELDLREEAEGYGTDMPKVPRGTWPRQAYAIIAESRPAEDRYCVNSEFTFSNCA